MASTVSDGHCEYPSYFELRSRRVEKPIDTERVLKLAHEQLEKVYQEQMEKEKVGFDGEEEDLEIVLVKNVSLQSFMDWTEESQQSIRPSFIPRDDTNVLIGDIVVTELGSGPHEAASGFWFPALLMKLSDISKPLRHTIKQIPSKDLKWSNGRVKRPDGGLKTLGDQLPTVVIEVAYSESFRQLQEDVHNWIAMTDHVRISLGVKIFTINTQGQRKMIMLYEDRQSEPKQIEFGINPTPERLEIPVSVLYQDVPQELQHVQNLEIDLIPLRNSILEEF